jgi:ATP phosphoribosyltransferase regulatory subunit
LAHPLPAGMRDLLPGEAETQRLLASKVLGTFELHGYQQVSVPAFEYADVLERGLGTIDPTSMLRFVEPESGEVVALRPDMTPQVARLVSTRLSERALPARISYRGSVLRRQHERARHDQQAQQAGIELVGASGPRADLEVLSVCVQAVRAAGLTDFVIDLGHGAIASLLLEGAAVGERPGLLEALSLKDGSEVARRAARSGLSKEAQVALGRLLSLHGGLEVFDAARDSLSDTKAWPAIVELRAVATLLVATQIAPRLVIDLGESRPAEYYTGPTFQILAEGPGRAVASGGRYDELYGQFGVSRAAFGGAIQLDHLRWALGDRLKSTRLRAVVVPLGGGDEPCATTQGSLQALREANIPCVCVGDAVADAYARDWCYTHLLRVAERGQLRVSRLDGIEEMELGLWTPENISEVVRI